MSIRCRNDEEISECGELTSPLRMSPLPCPRYRHPVGSATGVQSSSSTHYGKFTGEGRRSRSGLSGDGGCGNPTSVLGSRLRHISSGLGGRIDSTGLSRRDSEWKTVITEDYETRP